MLLLQTKTAEKYQIWTMKPDGTEQRKLIEEEKGIQKGILSPRWSPTGDAIYYFRTEGDTMDLVKLSASRQSTESSVLVSGLETGNYFTVSADGSQLAYTRAQDYSNLWLAELPALGAAEKAQEKPLTSGTLSYYRPSISPDGHWVAFTIGSGTKGNVYKMSFDSSQPVQLTFFDAAMSLSPAWSPDGGRIAFICDQGGAPKVWVVNADGGSARPLDGTGAADTDYQLTWFPSLEIVYQQPGLHNLRRLNIETLEERPFLSNDSKGWLSGKAVFSPNGKRVAIHSHQEGGYGMWVITLGEYSEKLLYRGDYYPIGWSPDGNSIYAFERGGLEILQIGLGDSKQSRSVITMPGVSSQAPSAPTDERSSSV
jgi:Tol biopolymer transport system component